MKLIFKIHFDPLCGSICDQFFGSVWVWKECAFFNYWMQGSMHIQEVMFITYIVHIFYIILLFVYLWEKCINISFYDGKFIHFLIGWSNFALNIWIYILGAYRLRYVISLWWFEAFIIIYWHSLTIRMLFSLKIFFIIYLFLLLYSWFTMLKLNEQIIKIHTYTYIFFFIFFH